MGSVIEEGKGRLLQVIGIDHVDVMYNGTVVYVGKGGGMERRGRQYQYGQDIYPLRKSSSGKMKYGKKSPCLNCKDATDSDILDCLNSRKSSAGKNCQGDVQDAVGDCCLSGFRSIVGTFFPTVMGQ